MANLKKALELGNVLMHLEVIRRTSGLNEVIGNAFVSRREYWTWNCGARWTEKLVFRPEARNANAYSEREDALQAADANVNNGKCNGKVLAWTALMKLYRCFRRAVMQCNRVARLKFDKIFSSRYFHNFVCRQFCDLE